MESPPVLEAPQVLQLLAELESIAMSAARNTSGGVERQLMAVKIAHQLLLDRMLVIEMRDLAAGQRHLDSAFARLRAERDGFD